MGSHRRHAQAGLAAAIFLFLVCMSLIAAGTIFRGDLQAALPGSVAPNFSLRDVNNKEVALSDLRGDLVVVYFDPAHPSNKNVAAADVMPVDLDGPQIDRDAAELQSPTTAPSVSVTSDLSQLSQLCHAMGGDSKVKFFEMKDDSNAGTASESTRLPMQTLVDSSGDVARHYKVDNAQQQPTFFVIDGNGVIRYRGSFSHGSDVADHVGPDASAMNITANPTTEPSSCPQVVQTLLSSQAVNLAMHSGEHF